MRFAEGIKPKKRTVDGEFAELIRVEPYIL